MVNARWTGALRGGSVRRSAMKMLSDGTGYLGALAGFSLRSGRSPGMPVSAFVEPTNVCNLRCPECAAGAGALGRPKGRMSADAFVRLLHALPRTVSELYLWGQGEPFKAPDFITMIGAASERGFGTTVSTNGHFLDDPRAIVESGLGTLIVSLDGLDAETYSSYRVGGDFGRVVEGIGAVAAARNAAGSSSPVIVLQCLLTRDTLPMAADFPPFARSIGADRAVLKTMQVLSTDTAPGCLPHLEKARRYRTASDGSLAAERALFLKDRCLRIYYSFQVDWQGNVLPCCFDKDSEYIMGNLFREDFEDIWNGPDFVDFRSMINRHGRVLDMCRNCTEGLKRKTVAMRDLRP